MPTLILTCLVSQLFFNSIFPEDPDRGTNVARRSTTEGNHYRYSRSYARPERLCNDGRVPGRTLVRRLSCPTQGLTFTSFSYKGQLATRTRSQHTQRTILCPEFNGCSASGLHETADTQVCAKSVRNLLVRLERR